MAIATLDPEEAPDGEDAEQEPDEVEEPEVKDRLDEEARLPPAAIVPKANDAASPAMRAYFAALKEQCDVAYALAAKARTQGWEPQTEVEIPQAEDLASRVENLLKPMLPSVEGVAVKIRALSLKHNREVVSLLVAQELARELAPKEGKEAAIEAAVRVGLAIITEGVLVAPLEGVVGVKIGHNDGDAANPDYVAVHYAGPIRAAGGTAQALSVLIADVVRRELGIGRFVATSAEVERLKEEIPAYKQAQHLQYSPTSQEIERIVKGCPVCIDGEGTEKEEISGNRDLPRVQTNQLRGGACLVMAEGLILKASKVQKHVKALNIEGWEFLDAFLNKGKADEGKGEASPLEQATAPSDKFLGDLVAGRPVLSGPQRKGGFRLRYGRARTAGLASTAIHPATMALVEDFLAVGTQMKIERPGKGTVCTPCDSLEGPMVLLDNGDFVRLDSAKQAVKLRPRVREIVDMGEILIPFGEFAENNKPLMPAGYCREWWLQEAQRKVPEVVEPGTCAGAVELSAGTGLPLHPAWVLFWHDVDAADVLRLREAALDRGRVEGAELVLPDEAAPLLRELGCVYERRLPADVAVREHAPALLRCLGLEVAEGRVAARVAPPHKLAPFTGPGGDALALVSALAGFPVRAKSPYRIGARMGRPEKAAERKMSPPVHVLFPLGQAGGLGRLIKDAAAKGPVAGESGARGLVRVEVGERVCRGCGERGFEPRCAACGDHSTATRNKPLQRSVDLRERLAAAQAVLGMAKLPETIKGVQGLVSKDKTPEALEKGLLRAKHDISVFKDGTVRFDCTDVPLTHFKPREARVSVERLRSLGYIADCKGQPLERDDQVLELKVQDVILPRNGLEYLKRTADFVDELLEKLYGLPPYYNCKEPDDLIGQLVVGLAPHTSGGVLARLVGSTKTQAGLAHPFWHAAKRRNCLAPESEVFVLNSPTPHRVTLAELYERSPNPELPADDVGTLSKEVSGYRVLAADRTTGAIEPRTVLRVYRVPSPAHLVVIRTASGRTLKCSQAHRLEVLAGGRLVKRTAMEVHEGDSLVFPGRVPLQEVPPQPLDLLAELAPDPPPGLVVRGLRAWLDEQVSKLGGLKAASEVAGVGMRALDNYRRRDSVPWSVLERMMGGGERALNVIPARVSLAVARDTVELPRVLPLTPELLRLCGYYLAEGYARGKPGEWFQVGIAASERDMVEDILRCAKTALGLSPRPGPTAITLSGRLVHALFTSVLAMGHDAHSKRIPPRLAALPRELTRELLAGYFSGDGSVEQGRLHVSCTSVSVGLLRDIGLQLAVRGIAYRLRREERAAGGAARGFYERKGRLVPAFVSHRLSIRSEDAVRFHREVGFSLRRKQEALAAVLDKERAHRFDHGPGDLLADPIVSIEPSMADSLWLYDMEVEEHHNFLVNDLLLTSNCDGDEDCVMLLLDGLLNFSRAYLPEKRGGLMDAPLVLTIRLDPREVDKEAHNLDVSWGYPLEFYEATQRCPAAKEVEHLIDNVAKRLGTPKQYEGFGFTHDTTDIGDGPVQSAYKTLPTMQDKLDAQMRIADKIRSVDAADVATRVIEGHLLRDFQGNLKKFSKQKVRCVRCNAKYRRPPLKGQCLRCSNQNSLTMTVHHASVIKYLEMSKRLCERYQVRAYTRQRLELLEHGAQSLFQSDKVKKTSLKDFFGG